MYYVGVDMAVEKHDICLMATDGRVLSEFTIPNNTTGFTELGHLLDGLDDIARINLERPDGLLVDWLASEEYQVYFTPPVLVAHRRGRRSKDDRGDAYTLAQMLYIKDPDCRPLPRQSQTVLHLVQLVKAYDDVMQEQHREEVRLLWTLRQYYPSVTHAFKCKYSPTFLAFLETYPTPSAAHKLTPTQLIRFLRKHRAYTAKRASTIYTALQLPTPPVLGEQGYVEAVRMLIPRLRLLTQQREQLHQRIVEVFNTHPEAAWWRTFPGTSGPLTPARLLAAMGDDRSRFPSAPILQAIAGTVPVTRRSGKKIVVEFREGCSKPLRKAVDDLARQSIRKSGWAQSYFNDQRARGHSKNRAYRALANRWLSIIWKLWQIGEIYSEDKHIANRVRRGQPIAA